MEDLTPLIALIESMQRSQHELLECLQLLQERVRKLEQRSNISPIRVKPMMADEDLYFQDREGKESEV